MAWIKISELTSKTTLAGTEVLPVADGSSNAKVSVDSMRNYIAPQIISKDWYDDLPDSKNTDGKIYVIYEDDAS